MLMINMEVVDAPLDYNNLLGCSFMYAMKVVTPFIFHVMMFPHKWNVITIGQLTHHKPCPLGNLDNVRPLFQGIVSLPSYTKEGLGFFNDSSFLGAYHIPPPFPYQD